MYLVTSKVIENYVILHYLLLIMIDMFLVLVFPYTAVHSSVSSSLLHRRMCLPQHHVLKCLQPVFSLNMSSTLETTSKIIIFYILIF